MTNSPLTPESSPFTLLAFDLGTTTLVGRMLRDDGVLLAEARVPNPQRSLGADILTRLQCAHEGGGEELQRLLVAGLRTLVGEVLAQAGSPAERVSAAAAAGNPGISHLLCALPVADLIFPPHRSPLKELTTLTPAELDLDLAVSLQLFPTVTGFVGGDLLADLYAVTHANVLNPGSPPRLRERPSHGSRLTAHEDLTPHPSPLTRHVATLPQSPAPGPLLLLDLGTNAELALWDGRRWLVTSAAAGPAFEAGNIACGMPLAPGAVTDVQLAGDRLALCVAGGGRPLGLCGSGLLALIAAARQGGLIDRGGRIVAPEEVGTNLARYLVAAGEGWALRFHRDARGELRLAQDDVRQLQLAKGAVRAGIEVLLHRAGLMPADLVAVCVTGAFGTALPVAAVKGIAMLPESVLDKLFFVANGVLDGLCAYLADPQGTAHLAALQATIQPFPLSGNPAFEQRFLAALEF
jgi:uncharacterized 2Fe-2S/4Fe-4S cluster protein (DUF4445 family)